MGTLYQIRNLLHRRNVTKNPKDNVNAAEDFLDLVTIGHVLAAAMSYLKMSSFEDIPSAEIVSSEVWMEDDSVRCNIIEDIASHIVDTHVDLSTEFKPTSSQNAGSVGTVYDYACEALGLGLLIMDFKDAVREGDGDRVLSLWKYLLLLFKASERKNYAIEALTLLAQYSVILPPNLAEQLKWSRFVNVHGRPGHNISCDLHMEHLNRQVKVAIDGLGPNKSKKAIGRVGKAMGILSEATKSYDAKVGINAPSGKHSDSKVMNDIKCVTEKLLDCDIFNPQTKQSHHSFLHLKKNLIRTLNEDKLKDWMVERFSMLLQPGLSPHHEMSNISNNSSFN